MIDMRKIECKYLKLDIDINSKDAISHSIVGKYNREYHEIVNLTLNYMRGLILALESEHKDELERISK